MNKSITLLGLLVLNNCSASTTPLMLQEGMKPGVHIHKLAADDKIDPKVIDDMNASNAVRMISERKNVTKYKSQTTSGDGLVNDVNLLKISFNYKPKQHAIGTVFLGFTPYMVEDKNGFYSGVGEAFNHPRLGACTYTVGDLIGSGSSIIFDKDKVTTEINGHPTVTDISGIRHKAYMYSARWATDRFEHTLECALKNENRDLLKELVETAKNFDKQGELIE